MSRQGETVSLRITLRYRSLDELVVRYAENVSSAGIFIRTRAPKPAGTRVRFELLLADGSRALRGEGVVVGARNDDKPGMSLRFSALEPTSEALVDRIVEAHGQGRLAPTPLSTVFDKQRTRPSGFGGGSGLGRGSSTSGWVPLGGRARTRSLSSTSGILPRNPVRSFGNPPEGKSPLLARPATSVGEPPRPAELAPLRPRPEPPVDRPRPEAQAPDEPTAPGVDALDEPTAIIEANAPSMAPAEAPEPDERGDEQTDVAPRSDHQTDVAQQSDEQTDVAERSEDQPEAEATDGDEQTEVAERNEDQPEAEATDGDEQPKVEVKAASSDDESDEAGPEALDANEAAPEDESASEAAPEPLEADEALARAQDSDRNDEAPEARSDPVVELPEEAPEASSDPVAELPEEAPVPEAGATEPSSSGSAEAESSAPDAGATEPSASSSAETESSAPDADTSSPADPGPTAPLLPRDETIRIAAQAPETLEPVTGTWADAVGVADTTMRIPTPDPVEERPSVAAVEIDPEDAVLGYVFPEDTGELPRFGSDFPRAGTLGALAAASPLLPRTTESLAEAGRDAEGAEPGPEATSPRVEALETPPEPEPGDSSPEPIEVDTAAASPDSEPVEGARPSSTDPTNDVPPGVEPEPIETESEPPAPGAEEPLSRSADLEAGALGGVDERVASPEAQADETLASLGDEADRGPEVTASADEALGAPEADETVGSPEDDVDLEPVGHEVSDPSSLEPLEAQSVESPELEAAPRSETLVSPETAVLDSRPSSEVDDAPDVGQTALASEEDSPLLPPQGAWAPTMRVDLDPFDRWSEQHAPEVAAAMPETEISVGGPPDARGPTLPRAEADATGPTDDGTSPAPEPRASTEPTAGDAWEEETMMMAREAPPPREPVPEPPAPVPEAPSARDPRVEAALVDLEDPGALENFPRSVLDAATEVLSADGAPTPGLESAPMLANVAKIIGVEVGRAAPPADHGFDEPTEIPPPRTKPTGPKKALGLDFGHHWVRLGYLESGQLELVPLKGAPYLPAFVAVRSDGRLIVGARAKAIYREAPSRAISPLVMLRALSSREAGSEVPLVEDPSTGATLLTLGDRRFDVGDILVAFLKEIRAAYATHFGHEHVRLVISIPTDLDDAAVAALRSACRETEIESFRLEPEPEALLRAYHLGEHPIEAALTVDVGVSRTTLALARRGTSGTKVVASATFPELSARALDRRIAEVTLEAFEELTGEAHADDPEALERTTLAIEHARPELRRSPHIDIKVHLGSPGGAGGVATERLIQVPRSRIEDETRDWVADLCLAAQRLLRDQDLSPRELGAVVLAGSAGAFPPLGEALGHLVGREPLASVPPIQALLLGLARSGQTLERKEQAALPDTLSSSIGLELPGGRFRPLIHAGTPLPTELVRQFPTTREGQTEIELRLFQGEGELTRLCSFLGALEVDGLPRRARGALTVELTLELNVDGNLRASLRETSSERRGILETSTQQTPKARRRPARAITTGAPAAKPRGLLGRLFGKS